MAVKDDVLDAIKNGTMPGGFHQAGQVADSASTLSMVVYKLPRYDVHVYMGGVLQQVSNADRREIVQDLLNQRIANDINPNRINL